MPTSRAPISMSVAVPNAIATIIAVSEFEALQPPVRLKVGRTLRSLPVRLISLMLQPFPNNTAAQIL